MDQSTRRRRELGQSPLGSSFPFFSVPEESPDTLVFLPVAATEEYREGSCVAVVRTAEEFVRCLRAPAPGVEWLQVEGLIGNPDVWALAAQGQVAIPLDVILDDPATEFSALYRLVDVRLVRSVRITMPAKLGFLKALRLAVSLQLPVTLLPGQADAGTLAELIEAARLYLHDPLVETPVEFFHSLLAAFRGMAHGTLWSFLEQDPAIFSHRDTNGQALRPTNFVETHLARLLEEGAECAACRWQAVCAGYFKSPDPTYDCSGVKELLSLIEAAAAEITRELATRETLTQA